MNTLILYGVVLVVAVPVGSWLLLRDMRRAETKRLERERRLATLRRLGVDPVALSASIRAMGASFERMRTPGGPGGTCRIARLRA